MIFVLVLVVVGYLIGALILGVAAIAAFVIVCLIAVVTWLVNAAASWVEAKAAEMEREV